MSDDLTPDEPMGADGSATFDMSGLTASDVPYIGPQPGEDVPDHNASADVPPLAVDDLTTARKGRRGRKDKRTREVPPKPRPGSLVRPLEQFYTSVGVTLSAFDAGCGMAVVENAKTCAESLDTLARENDAVRRAILLLTETSAWGGVMIAHLPILLMVATHHGPREVGERIAPLAATMAPNAFAAAAQQYAQQHAPQSEGPAA